MSHSHTPTHTVAAARDGHANTATVRPNDSERERKWCSVNLCEKSFLLIKWSQELGEGSGKVSRQAGGEEISGFKPQITFDNNLNEDGDNLRAFFFFYSAAADSFKG